MPDILLCPPGIRELHMAGGVHVLAWLESDRLSGGAFHCKPKQCGAVLWEDISIFACDGPGAGNLDFRGHDVFYLESLCRDDRRTCECFDDAGWGRGDLHLLPCPIIKPGCV